MSAAPATSERGAVCFVHAAAAEGRALALAGLRSRELGVGKVAAAASLTRLICAWEAAGEGPALVCLLGIGGAYPAEHMRAGLEPLTMLEACVIESDAYADEGVATPEGFRSLADMSLGTVGPFPADPEGSQRVAAALGCARVLGATVSTGAGTDALSRAHAQRSGAQIESMEGAAVASVCAGAGLAMVQVRVVSNHTGARTEGAWDLQGSLARLTEIAAGVEACLRPS